MNKKQRITQGRELENDPQTAIPDDFPGMGKEETAIITPEGELRNETPDPYAEDSDHDDTSPQEAEAMISEEERRHEESAE
ncbi:MAG TPA: hypothetical protein VJJ72_02310 [Candidatus Paceibacterota bacterium]